MYISRIQLRHIRGFRELDLNFLDGDNQPRMRTVVVGKNGTGKTTLLRCIAIGLSDRTDANAMLSENIGPLVMHGEEEGTISIKLASRPGGRSCGQIKTTITKVDKKEQKEEAVREPGSQDEDGPPMNGPLMICAYGAGRSTTSAEDTFRQYRIVDSVYSLFVYQAALLSTELVMRRLRDFQGTTGYENSMKGIKKVLGLTYRHKIELPLGGGVEVSGPDVREPIPLDAWADGYKLTFSWILDFYAWAMRAETLDKKSGKIHGILLMDEIEQHVHPSMQMELLSAFSRFQPEVQIVATTHSPLVALGASPDEVVVLQRRVKNVVAENYVPDFTGYSAEDMLTDKRLFDSKAIPPRIRRKMQEYERLCAIPRGKRTPKDTKRLRGLATELGQLASHTSSENPVLAELSKLRNELGL